MTEKPVKLSLDSKVAELYQLERAVGLPVTEGPGDQMSSSVQHKRR